MKADILDKWWNIVKTVNIKWPVWYDASTCIVCEDIADYVWYFLNVYKWNDIVYTWYIEEYQSSPTVRQLKLRPLIYHLWSNIFEWDYDNVDVVQILHDIVDDFVNKTWFPLFTYQDQDNVWITLTYSFRNVSHLQALQIIIRTLKDWYFLKYNFWWNTDFIITQWNVITVDEKNIAEIWYNSVMWVIINKVKVSNWVDIEETVRDDDSINKYWERFKSVIADVKTSEDAINIWNKILNEYANPKKDISFIKLASTLWINKLNQDVDINWNKYYITANQVDDNYITYKLSDKPVYPNYVDVTYNESFNINLNYTKTYVDQKVDEEVNLVWIRWWSHNIRFDAVDNDTVQWSSWTIYLPNWDTFDIDSWDTWDMSDITYIYLDTDISTTSLQLTTDASESVWKNKLLICVAWPVDDTNKLAVFQVFGNDWKWVFITADNIATDTITANEIASNTITANEIASWAITTETIAIGAVDSDRVDFNYADSSSKWWNARDTDAVAWYDASIVWRWWNKADDALNDDNRYQKWLDANDITESKYKWNYTWVIIDSDWLWWYNNWDKVFEIDLNWNAFFKWQIWASSITSDGYLRIYDSDDNEIKIHTPDKPQIQFYYEWTDVWYLYWYETTVAWKTVKWIYASNNIGCRWDLVVWDDWAIWWDLAVVWQLYVAAWNSTTLLSTQSNYVYIEADRDNDPVLVCKNTNDNWWAIWTYDSDWDEAFWVFQNWNVRTKWWYMWWRYDFWDWSYIRSDWSDIHFVDSNWNDYVLQKS